MEAPDNHIDFAKFQEEFADTLKKVLEDYSLLQSFGTDFEALHCKKLLEDDKNSVAKVFLKYQPR
jgi:hypothetical protein